MADALFSIWRFLRRPPFILKGYIEILLNLRLAL